MNLSAKERIMVVALILVTIWGVGIALILMPTYKSIDERQAVLEDVQNEFNIVNSKLLAGASLDSRIAEATQMIDDDLSIFNVQMYEYEVDIFITALFASHNVAISSITISQLALEELVKYKPVYVNLNNNFTPKTNQDDIKTEGEAAEAGEMIATSTVYVSYTGRYTDVKELIEKIHSLDRAIYIDVCSIDNVNTEAAEDDEELGRDVTGGINLKVYCVPKAFAPVQ